MKVILLVLNKYKSILTYIGEFNNYISPNIIIRSIPEKWFDSDIKKHVVDIIPIREACSEKYLYKENMPFAFRTDMHFSRRNIYCIKNIFLNTITGACRTNGSYFQESYGSLRRCILEKPFPYKNKNSLNNDGLVTCVHATGYYHFLLEEIPRLIWVLTKYPRMTVVVHRSAPNFVLEILQYFKESGDISEVLVLNKENIFINNKYVFTQAEAYSGFVHSSDIEIVRNYFLTKNKCESKKMLNIYISRRNSIRTFDNENEIEKLLLSKGFKIVQLEDLTIQNKITLFKQAKTIIAPHGAGLANLVWCCQGVKVIELFSKKQFNDAYARLSSTLHLNYESFWAEESIGWGNIDLVNFEKKINNE